jgi:hypothetical protein
MAVQSSKPILFLILSININAAFSRNSLIPGPPLGRPQAQIPLRERPECIGALFS